MGDPAVSQRQVVLDGGKSNNIFDKKSPREKQNLVVGESESSARRTHHQKAAESVHKGLVHSSSSLQHLQHPAQNAREKLEEWAHIRRRHAEGSASAWRAEVDAFEASLARERMEIQRKQELDSIAATLQRELVMLEEAHCERQGRVDLRNKELLLAKDRLRNLQQVIFFEFKY